MLGGSNKLDYNEEFQKWLNSGKLDENDKNALKKMSDNPSLIKESFCQNLTFGTGGLRGIIGLGTNRMNKYVVRRATQGIANYILDNDKSFKDRGVVIAYDSRHYSPEFALETALTMCANGIKAYLFESLRPTPELSFAIRYLKAISGIVITASHNPAEYNGYKAYWEDGGQLPPAVSDKVLEYINAFDMFESKTMDYEDAKKSGLLQIIGKEVDDAYIDAVYTQAINPDVVKEVADEFKLVYTPIHGSGNKPVRAILEKSGFKHVIVVKEQELPDGSFPTVKSPNPENKECFTKAVELARENDVSLIIGTDPDADRMGIMLRNQKGEYITMSGNQVGVLLADYIISAKKERGILPKNGAVISTIVSTKMAKVVTESFGMKYIETLTGFKFIGEKIHEFETTKSNEFLLGFEESYGYLVGTHARDKDSVVASMLIAEMAAYYYKKGETLYDVMQKLYKKHGGFAEKTVSITMEGSEGIAKIKQIMEDLRANRPQSFGNFKVNAIRDYKAGIRYDINGNSEEKLTLPNSDVLYFELSDGASFVARPSGTEPKIKMYYLIQSDTEENAKAILEKVINDVSEYFN
ncbi:MAG: phospho-sugar mutase [Clostridia bacterium]|nr:phospho-sugar mutase [Clostridia bacterium]